MQRGAGKLPDLARLHRPAVSRWQGRNLGRTAGDPRTVGQQRRKLARPAREAEELPPAGPIFRRQSRTAARGRCTIGRASSGEPGWVSGAMRGARQSDIALGVTSGDQTKCLVWRPGSPLQREVAPRRGSTRPVDSIALRIERIPPPAFRFFRATGSADRPPDAALLPRFVGRAIERGEIEPQRDACPFSSMHVLVCGKSD